MGQKVHPTGIRLGIATDWSSKWYANKTEFPKFILEDIKVREYLKKKLAHASVSKILIERPAKEAVVTIFTARPGIVIGKKGEDIEKYRQHVAGILNISKNTVFADGNPNSQIMLIGEAPGRDEDLQGTPFVGQAGQLLNKMLSAIGLDRTKVYITNIIPWRPPGNRQPTIKETIMCLPFVQRHIELIDPKILIMVGGTAAKALLETSQGIIRSRGKWYNYKVEALRKTIPARAILHPAYLLRSPAHKKETWFDLLEISDIVMTKISP